MKLRWLVVHNLWDIQMDIPLPDWMVKQTFERAKLQMLVNKKWENIPTVVQKIRHSKEKP